MSMSGGGSKSTQESKPLTPQEMQGYYDQAMTNLKPLMPGVTPVQQQTLTDGDYQALTDAYTAPVLRDKALAMKDSNQNAADRGIFTSLNALRLNNDVNERFAPQIAAAGGKALEMKAAEQTQGNQISAANEQAKWRPADYLQSLWTGGKGQTTNGTSFAANGGFSI